MYNHCCNVMIVGPWCRSPGWEYFSSGLRLNHLLCNRPTDCWGCCVAAAAASPLCIASQLYLFSFSFAVSLYKCCFCLKCVIWYLEIIAHINNSLGWLVWGFHFSGAIWIPCVQSCVYMAPKCVGQTFDCRITGYFTAQSLKNSLPFFFQSLTSKRCSSNSFSLPFNQNKSG